MVCHWGLSNTEMTEFQDLKFSICRLLTSGPWPGQVMPMPLLSCSIPDAISQVRQCSAAHTTARVLLKQSLATNVSDAHMLAMAIIACLMHFSSELCIVCVTEKNTQ